ncbi:pao retrotransposon peptidase domain-containing protein [Phthorimaea operculella]|nr:pao retrotransposon peptidase domain-containing protein [Phthorimaea operculella]
MELRSLDKTFTTPIQCLVLPELTYNLQGHTLLRKDFFKYIPDNITLADPTFYESRKVDILIGVDRFWDLVIAGKIRLLNGPYLINTKLGWIIGGSVSGYTKQSSKYVNCNFTQTLDIQESIDMPSLDKQVRSFWELEELPISAKPVDSRSDDERACEEHFLHTMKRTSEGRFCVRIPFKYEPDLLDASLAAYGACAYVRTIDNVGNVTVRLLCSKGRVASIKPVLTIPRLELCGALVGARLYDKISRSLRSTFDRVVFWSDSTIVLGHSWRHVSGVDNPADLVSRGQSVDALNENNLWFTGPSFLHDPTFDSSEDDQIEVLPENLPELKTHDTHTLKRKMKKNYFRFRDDKWKGVLTVTELNQATITLARLSQRESFSDVRDSLVLTGQVSKKQTHLSKLDLFIDKDQLVRVGGRIQDSPNFDFDKKHPILISSKHHFSILLFRFEHKRLMHASPQLLLCTIRESWWPLGGRNLARQTCHACVKCVRMRGVVNTPFR